MTLVDTSVWVDYFADRDTPQARRVVQMLEQDEDLCICGPILTEVLQGIRHDKDYVKTKQYFGHLVYLPVGRRTYLRAADLYREARKHGETLRRTIDCIIAACAIQHSVFLLENDSDFDAIARYSTLKQVL
jgi:predicted nucleic acid-binding protein